MLAVQTVLLPVIVPGCPGVVAIVTGKVCVGELPHALEAVTVMLPALAPAVTVMLLVMLLPLHPPGMVQTYPVAPPTGFTE